jgi:Fe-S cluster assembly protein SufD
VFDGNVRVNRLAQKTDAQQLSRNLLLVPRATVNVKPNLQVPQDARGDSLGCCLSCSLLGAPPAECTSSFNHSSLITITDPCLASLCLLAQIIADDVKCTHGCTVSDLEEEELFYLR